MDKIFKQILFVFLLCCFSKSALCQSDVSGAHIDSCLLQPFCHYHWPKWWVLHSRTFLAQTPVEYGMVILENGSDMEGLLTYSDFTKSYDFGILPKGKESQGDMFIFYESKLGAETLFKKEGRIKSFSIYNDSINKTCRTDFVNLSKPYNLRNYRRVLGRKNDIQIVDKFVFTFKPQTKFIYKDYTDKANINKRKLLLVTKDGYTKIYGWTLFRNVNKSIRRFINKRYHTSFHKNDFKSTGAMIDYILEKENKR